MKAPQARALWALLVTLLTIAATSSAASATGTVRVQQRDGTAKTYTNVHIAIKDEAMAITSSDGKGTLVLGKAACTKVDELIECLPYDATLFQNGRLFHIRLQSGTVWLNPSMTRQRLTHSSTELPPRGVELAVTTMRGTYVTMTGVVDEVHK
ncbi:MAG: hypothetical protein JO078_04795 [Candidatus Eremiobacteraeota bacterium]|nr:hypothetical protein [Candidatus Eremiobacteraeota bacterium]